MSGKYRNNVNVTEMWCFTNASFLGMWSWNYETRMIMSLCTQVTFSSKMYLHPWSRLVAGCTPHCGKHSDSELCFHLHCPKPTSHNLHSVAPGIYSISWCKLKLLWAAFPSYPSNLSRYHLLFLLVFWIHNYIGFGWFVPTPFSP